MISVSDKDIGRKVIYNSGHDVKQEEGVITSFNRFYVFVRYGDETQSKATSREDLFWP